MIFFFKETPIYKNPIISLNDNFPIYLTPFLQFLIFHISGNNLYRKNPSPVWFDESSIKIQFSIQLYQIEHTITKIPNLNHHYFHKKIFCLLPVIPFSRKVLPKFLY